MGELAVLVKKEILENIRNPRLVVFTIVVPVLIFPILGFIMNVAVTFSAERAQSGTIVIYDNDRTEISGSLKAYLQAARLNVVVAEHSALKELPDGAIAIVEIPKGFGDNVLNNMVASLFVHIVIKELSLGEQGVVEAITHIIRSYEEYLAALVGERYGVDPRFILDPINETISVYVASLSRTLSSSELGTLMMQSLFWPFLTLALIASVTQISAASMGEEKEQKTLEILLTFPIKRSTILLSKVFGSSVIALLASTSYMIGFLVYLSGIFKLRELSDAPLLIEIPANIDAGMLVLIGAMMFLLLFFNSALGLIVSIVAKDTKTAEGLASMIIFPLIAIVFLVAFLGVSNLPMYLQAVLYAIPYTYLVESIKYIVLGRMEMFYLGIAVTFVVTVALVMLVSKLFESEGVLTFKVELGRRRVRSIS